MFLPVFFSGSDFMMMTNGIMTWQEEVFGGVFITISLMDSHSIGVVINMKCTYKDVSGERSIN